MKALKVEISDLEKTERLLGNLLGKMIKAYIITNGLIIFPDNESKEKEMNLILSKNKLKPTEIEAPLTNSNSGWYLRYRIGQDCIRDHFIKLKKIPCDISVWVEALQEAIIIWELNPSKHPVRKEPELVLKIDLCELRIGI